MDEDMDVFTSTRFFRVALAFLVVVFVSALLFVVAEGDVETKDLASGLFALLGTFTGALLAFRFEEEKEKSKEKFARKAALNRAIVVLGYQHNEVRTYRELVAPYANDVELAFNFPASQPPERIDVVQKFDELTFLLNLNEPQIVFELIIEQVRFDQVLQSIRNRNAFFVEKVQPVFAARGFNNRLVNSGELQHGLGEYLYGGALMGARNIREHLDGSNESLPIMIDKVRKVAKGLFPGDKFVSFAVIPLAGEMGE